MTDQETAAARKAAIKAKMLVEQIGLAAGLASAFAPRIRMVKAATRPGVSHRIICEDGGWIEIDQTGRVVRTWGPGRTARDLATGLKDDAYAIEHLEPTVTAAAPGAPRRSSPTLNDSQAKSLADRWRARGFEDVTEDQRGVWVVLDGGARLYDVGGRVSVYGPVTDEALRAMVTKAKDEWGGRHVLSGSWTDRDRERMWLESMRQGVTMLDYEPSAKLLAKWEAEQETKGRSTARVMRPNDAALASASTSPVPAAAGAGGTAEPESETPGEPKPDLSAFDRKAADLDRRRVDLERRQRATIKDRQDIFMREQHLDLREAQDAVFRERDAMRQEQERLDEARAIMDRAREIAIKRGLDYKSAIALARAEHLADEDHSYDPKIRLRR